MNGFRRTVTGFSLVEVLVTVVILGFILVGVGGVVEQALRAEAATRERNDLTRQARFALQRMTAAVSASDRLLVPQAENPATAWSEAVRDPGVVAVTLDPTLDRDGDGWADANNDKDFEDLNLNGARDPGEPERIDEDVGTDPTNDGAPGIIGIDDDGDGVADNAGDAAVYEDFASPGDEDEDGMQGEDWFDAVAYLLSASTLLERMPNANPVDGRDYTERAIAENVATFRVERIAQDTGRAVLVDITLGLAGKTARVELHTRVRVGARP